MTDMSGDFYRLTERGEEQAEPLVGLVEFVIGEFELEELIRHTITERKPFDTARQIAEAIVADLNSRNSYPE